MRLRVTYAKTGTLRFTGHLDLHMVWERAIRRAGLPLAYTQGFHPGPRIQIAAALPLGFTGRREWIDLWLVDDSTLPPPSHLVSRLQAAAPPGLEVLAVEQVENSAPALQALVSVAEYRLTLPATTDLPGLQTRLAALLVTASLPRERRGKPYDLRPLILELTLQDNCLLMHLSAREGATGRPEEVLAVLNLDPVGIQIERLGLQIAPKEPAPPSL